MTVPYTFADAVGAIPLSELDANFAAIPNYANTAGIVVTPAQTAITSVGTLANLSVAGNVVTGGVVSATGNITGNYIIGNGSQLTGLPASYGNANVAAYLPTYTGNIAGNNIGVSGAINAVGEITSFANLVTTGEVQATGNITGSNLGLTGLVSATGNIRGANFISSGVVSASGNITAANFLGNVAAGTVSASGNITAANFLGNVAAGTVSASGNITTAGYFVGTFAGSISGNVTAPGTNTQVVYNNSGNLAGSAGFTFSSGANSLVVTGNVTGANLLTAGLISATSTITSATSITGGNLLTGGVISAAGNVRGSNINTTGLITATGNVVGNYFIGNGSQLTGVASTSARANITVYSGSLAANAAANIVATGYLGYGLYSISANAASWVTLYTSNAAAASDYSRTINTDPTPGSGVIAEAIGVSSGTISFTPAVMGYNDESPPTVAIPMKIVNNGNVTTNISVTLTLLKLEG
jgi:hypothetical protein